MNKIKVMIVEDEAIIALDIKERLKNLGFEVCEITSSKETAIEEAGRCRPDIVLMDIMLKGKPEGLEAAKTIKESFNIPVLYLTASTDPQVLEKAGLISLSDFIQKPFNDKELQSKIKEVLKL